MGYVEDIRAIVGHRPLILVGAVVIVINEAGQILLEQRKQPEGSWAIPGGLMELGESVEDTARRELYEETNLKVGGLKLINVYSGSKNFSRLPNGDEFYVVTIAFYTQEYEGSLIVNRSESLDFKFFSIDQLPEKLVKSHVAIMRDFKEKLGNE